MRSGFLPCHQPAAKTYAAQQAETTGYKKLNRNIRRCKLITRSQHRHTVAVTLVNIYKIKNNVNIARIALMNDNDTRAYIHRIGLCGKRYSNVGYWRISGKSGSTTRVATIKDYLPNNKQKALDELNALFDDLLLLANNLEITE